MYEWWFQLISGYFYRHKDLIKAISIMVGISFAAASIYLACTAVYLGVYENRTLVYIAQALQILVIITTATYDKAEGYDTYESWGNHRFTDKRSVVYMLFYGTLGLALFYSIHSHLLGRVLLSLHYLLSYGFIHYVSRRPINTATTVANFSSSNLD